MSDDTQDRIEQLRRLLHGCNTVTIEMGNPRGLSDCVDNHGSPYMSQELADVLAEEPLPKPIRLPRPNPTHKE